MIKNTEMTYGSGTRLLHWTISILIISLLIVGFYMTSLQISDNKWYIYGLHKATGVVILGLVILRIIWRFTNVWPGLPRSVPRWQALVAKINIFFLYCAMLTMPLTGFFGSLLGGHDISFFGFFTIPAIAQDKEAGKWLFEVHDTVAYILVALIGLHFFAALYHHFIMKDNVLKRMIMSNTISQIKQPRRR